ncbi:MAG TPA: DUF3489 domain-containing protein [Sphingomicrobium sp.]|jgi:hypothetical protein
MPRKLNLSDYQRVLLSTASQRETAMLLPLPASITAPERLANEVPPLLKHKLVEERVASRGEAVWREMDDQRLTLVITSAGCAAIGITADVAQVDEPPAPLLVTKAALVREMLVRGTGATLAELTAATGWQPHSVRAVLTGLRKKQDVEKGRRGDVTCYRIVTVR